MAEPVAAPPQNAASPPPSSGLGRQLALVGVLVVLVGMLGFDLFVLAPAALKADENLEKLVSEKNQAGIKPGDAGDKRDRYEHLVTSADIHKWMNGKPTKRIDKGFYTLEYYNMWGVIPIPRQYICVVYQTGKDGAPDLYASHHRNREPEDQDLPKDPAKIPPPKVDGSKAPPSGPPGTIPGTRPAAEGPNSEGAPSDKPAEPSEKPADAPAEKPTEEPAEKPAAEPADKPATDPPAEKTPATEDSEK